MSGTVLILGATGRFGRNAAEAFWNAGWNVRVFDRSKDDLNAAVQGVDVVVNGWNPPYTAWARDVPEFTKAVIAAAKVSGATVIIPGNVYVYGAGSAAVLKKDTPHAAANSLGQIRIQMEAAFRDAGVKTIVLRAGDFIDTQPSGNWFDMFIAKGAARGKVVSPGDPTAVHAWAYLPDMARAAVELAERRDSLDRFQEVLFPGYSLSVNELASIIGQATGRQQHVTRFNWTPIRLAALVWPMGRKLLEMRYLWSMPHRMSDEDMARHLPNFHPTDPASAVRRAVAHLDIDPDKSVSRRSAHLLTE